MLNLEPQPRRVLEGTALDAALTVAADFIDLKSPFRSGHSRRCAQLAADAAAMHGAAEQEITLIRRAAFLHEFGTTAIPNSILDKSGSLTRAEFDRVQLHTVLTEQMLARPSAFAALNPTAAAHHEKCDGSGYHKGLRADATDRSGRLLAAVDVYVGLTTDRSDRPALSADAAATKMRELVSLGELEPAVVDAVLAAAGHQLAATSAPRKQGPGGLSRRELEVLRLAARGLTTRQIADQLFISAKTADHHVQHVCTKINVSTRAGAALWAMEHDLVH